MKRLIADETSNLQTIPLYHSNTISCQMMPQAVNIECRRKVGEFKAKKTRFLILDGQGCTFAIHQRQDRWDDAIGHWKQVHRIRSLEPTGLLKLAEAQIHQKLRDAADATLDQLEETNWPPRFSNVRQEVRRLRTSEQIAGR